jgi:hypothetical protein
MSGLGFYELDLKELGIASVENRNILYHYPPFPQPSNSIVKLKVFWDIKAPFTSDDIHIYNLNGEKVNTENQIRIEKEDINSGHIIWDNSNHQPGIYFVKIKHGTETRFEKIMVIH